MVFSLLVVTDYFDGIWICPYFGVVELCMSLPPGLSIKIFLLFGSFILARHWRIDSCTLVKVWKPLLV